MEAFAHYWPFVMGIPGNTLIPLTKGAGTELIKVYFLASSPNKTQAIA